MNDNVKPLFRDLNYVAVALDKSRQTIKRWGRSGLMIKPCNFSEFARKHSGGTEIYMWPTDALNDWYRDFTGNPYAPDKF